MCRGMNPLIKGVLSKMKRFRNILTFILALILSVSSLSLSATASTDSYDDVYDSEEYEFVKNNIDYDELQKMQEFLMESDDPSSSVNRNDVAQDSEEISLLPYKIFYMTPEDFNSFEGTETEIENLTTTAYNWIVPTNTGYKITLSQIDEQWEVVDYSTVTENSDIIEINKFVPSDAEKTNVMDDIEHKNVVCFHITFYHTSFLCYTDNGVVYLVPYSSRPDITGLVNGESYEINEAKKILCSAFSESGDVNQSDSDAIYGGGIEANSNLKNNYLIFTIIVLSVVIFGFFAFLFFANRKKNKVN